MKKGTGTPKTKSTTRSRSAPKKEAEKAASGSERFSGPEAMVEVLRLAGEPLKTKVLVERALADPRVTGLNGKTPGAALAAKLA